MIRNKKIKRNEANDTLEQNLSLEYLMKEAGNIHDWDWDSVKVLKDYPETKDGNLLDISIICKNCGKVTFIFSDIKKTQNHYMFTFRILQQKECKNQCNLEV